MTSQSHPTVSIGLVVYNGERFLAEAIECLLAQTFEDFELIVSDNRSSDGTQSICERLAMHDSRIRYVRNTENIGVAGNFNQTVRLARGRYFKCAAHDDLHEPTFLEQCIAPLEEDPGMVLAHSAVRMVDENGTPLCFDTEIGGYRDGEGRLMGPKEPSRPAESDLAVTRFDDVLHRLQWCFQIFGVIRVDALLRTSLHKSFYGADKTLLSELALLGRFHEVDAPLYVKRCHADMSKWLTPAERREHIDPGTAQRFGGLLLMRAYFAALGVTELTMAQRAQCAISILRKVLGSHTLKRYLGAVP